MHRYLLFAIALLAVSASSAAQTTRFVPEQYATITSAMTAASNGDTISVAPGTYNERVSFGGKDVALSSRKGAAVTIIDATGTSAGPVVKMISPQTIATILDGFTIRGGTGGAGIETSYCSPFVRHCVIRDNTAQYAAGVSCQGGSPHFRDCLITENHAWDYAVLMGFAVDGALFENCTITRNHIGSTTPVSTVFAVHDNNSHSTLRNSIVWGNIPVAGSPLFDGNFMINDTVWGSDPHFVDAANGEFRLLPTSPCIDAGAVLAATDLGDLAGYPRVIDGDLDTLERIDIGAYERATLVMSSTGQLSTLLQLESWGTPGATSTFYFARGGPVTPWATTFGEVDLDRTIFGSLFVGTIGAGQTSVFSRPLPSSPIFLGQTFSFQALTTSGAAPHGAAFSNVVSLTIVP